MQTIVDRSELGDEAGLRSFLASALEEEVELLDKLREIFLSQRQALADGDPAALDDGVFAATRVLRTLDEARRRRTRITRGLAGSDVEFEELDTVLTGSSNRPIRVAQERVREATAALRKEVAILRRILHMGLSDNRRYLDTLLGEHTQPQRAGGYGEERDGTPGSGPGAVVNRTL